MKSKMLRDDTHPLRDQNLQGTLSFYASNPFQNRKCCVHIDGDKRESNLKSYEILILCGSLGRPPKLNGLAFLIRAIPREDIRNVRLDTLQKNPKSCFTLNTVRCTVLFSWFYDLLG